MKQESHTAASSPLRAGPLERRRCPLWHCGLESSIFQRCRALLGHLQLVVLQSLQATATTPVMCSDRVTQHAVTTLLAGGQVQSATDSLAETST